MRVVLSSLTTNYLLHLAKQFKNKHNLFAALLPVSIFFGIFNAFPWWCLPWRGLVVWLLENWDILDVDDVDEDTEDNDEGPGSDCLWSL